MFFTQSFVKRVPCLVFVTLRASSSYKVHEKSKLMQKLLGQSKKGTKHKRQWYKPHLGDPSDMETKKSRKGISHVHNVRIRQLSHVLYDKITEIINTGELSQDILENQVVITSVKVTKDLNNLNIYWDADRTDWEAVEQLLLRNSGKLRGLLISYHVLGRIPHIVFVKDDSTVNLNQLNGLFEKADYGPDYTPRKFLIDNILEEDLQRRTYCDSILDDSNIDNNNNEQNYSTDYDDKKLNDSLERLFHKACDLNDEHQVERDQLSERKRHNVGLISVNGDSDVKLNFRSDLYGLNRDEIMKKIQTKKKRLNISEEGRNVPLLDFDKKSDIDIVPPSHNPMTTKIKSMRKLVKEERRQKERMLERDDYEF